jgi:TRAP-type C4-dicarboxylate transport system permease small subunit
LTGSFLLRFSGILAAASPSSSPSQAPAVDPVINLTSGWAFAFVVGIAALVVFATCAVLWMNHRAAVKLQEQVTSIISSDYSAADKGALIAAVHTHTGARGATRTVIALLVMTLAGVALAATLVSGASDAVDLRKTIITSLLTFLAVIGGFYFGTRAVQDSQAGAQGQPSNGTAAAKITAQPAVTQLAPLEGAPEVPVSITGSGAA